jgi:glycosyltransferase involved in cell wall biosynthesis
MTRPQDRLVSVVIPTHNRKGVVGETIDSVLGQTHPNVEVVVVDDGSTDGTTASLRERYGERIVVVHQQNAGVEAARKHGMQVSRGEFVNFLDDDDLLYPHKLARQVEELHRNPRAGLVHCAFDFIGPSGEYLETSRDLPSGDVRVPLTRGCFPWSGGPLLRRECLSLISDDDHRDWYGDWGMWLRVALGGWEFALVDEPLGGYRQLPGSMTDALVRNVERLVLNVLASVFARGDVPNGSFDQRRVVYGGWHTWIGFRYFSGGQWERGARNIDAAMALQPWLLREGRLIAGMAVSDATTPRMRLQDPVSHLHAVLDHLPASARAGVPHRRWAEAQVLLRCALAEYGAGRPDVAAEHLDRAIAVDEAIAHDVHGFAGLVVEQSSRLDDAHQVAFPDVLFEHLPMSAAGLAPARPRAAAKLALAHARTAHAAGDRRSVLVHAGRAIAARPSLEPDDARRIMGALKRFR